MIGDAHQRDCCFPDCMGWHIEKNTKPIPDRNHDYDFWHDDYDGADGGNGLAGTACSVLEAMDKIGEIVREKRMDALNELTEVSQELDMYD